jgi:CBS-domain-containing membrane protein
MATAADIMTRQIVTVAPDTAVQEIADLLASHRFGSLPVLRADGVVMGVVREEDMVARAARIHLPRHIDFLGGIIYLDNPQRFEEEAQKILALTARDLMEADFITVAPETPVTDVAAQLLSEDIRRVLVLDAMGHLLGIITRADIVRMLSTHSAPPAEPAPDAQ